MLKEAVEGFAIWAWIVEEQTPDRDAWGGWCRQRCGLRKGNSAREDVRHALSSAATQWMGQFSAICPDWPAVVNTHPIVNADMIWRVTLAAVGWMANDTSDDRHSVGQMMTRCGQIWGRGSGGREGAVVIVPQGESIVRQR